MSAGNEGAEVEQVRKLLARQSLALEDLRAQLRTAQAEVVQMSQSLPFCRAASTMPPPSSRCIDVTLSVMRTLLACVPASKPCGTKNLPRAAQRARSCQHALEAVPEAQARLSGVARRGAAQPLRPTFETHCGPPI